MDALGKTKWEKKHQEGLSQYIPLVIVSPILLIELKMPKTVFQIKLLLPFATAEVKSLGLVTSAMLRRVTEHVRELCCAINLSDSNLELAHRRSRKHQFRGY